MTTVTFARCSTVVTLSDVIKRLIGKWVVVRLNSQSALRLLHITKDRVYELSDSGIEQLNVNSGLLDFVVVNENVNVNVEVE